MITRRVGFPLLIVCVVRFWSGDGNLLAQASPQAGPALEIGSRVRVTAPTVFQGRLVGSVRRIAADTLFLRDADGLARALPVQAVTEIELSGGRRYVLDRGRGAALGALAGGTVLGAVVLSGSEVCIAYETCLRNDPAGAAGAFVLGAIPGALAGGLLGLPRRWEEWREVHLGRVRAISLARGRIGVTIAVP